MSMEKDFLKNLQGRIKKIDPQSADFKALVKELIEFIQNGTTQQQKDLLGNILRGQQKQMQDVTLGFGDGDYLGSTKLGPCTATMFMAALGQGAELGSINANRTSKLNQDFEQIQEQIIEVANELNFNPRPSPYDN